MSSFAVANGIAATSRAATASTPVIVNGSSAPVIVNGSSAPVIVNGSSAPARASMPTVSAAHSALAEQVTPKPDAAYDAANIVESGSSLAATPKNETVFPKIELAVGGVRGVPGRKISRPQRKDVCMSIEDGQPANFHHDDADQFVVMDGELCKPVLSLVDDSCAAHMEIGTRCASFCQTSMFHSFGTPVDLMPGHVCREGEQCELKHEKSKTLQISNKAVDRHAKDTTVSLTPGATWGFGISDVSIPVPDIPSTRKRDIVLKETLRRRLAGDKPALTGYRVIDSIVLKMREQAAAEAAGMLFNTASQPLGVYDEFDDDDNEGFDALVVPANGTANGTVKGFGAGKEMEPHNDAISLAGIFKSIKGMFKGKPAANNNAANAAAAPQNKATISLPLPSITNPAGSLSATFTRHWLHEKVHTHYRASQTGEFTSLTHKQVPGDGCGSFYLVPVQITSCGWQALPRVPRHMQEDVLNWLATASIDEIDDSDFKRGLWSRDGDHKQRGRYQKPMWQIGPGGCPATYHEFPTCTSSFVKNADGSAMGRVVYVKKDCDSGRPLHHAVQPRPYRESVDFDDIFHEHLLKDPRLFNPGLGHLPPLTKAEDGTVEEVKHADNTVEEVKHADIQQHAGAKHEDADEDAEDDAGDDVDDDDTVEHGTFEDADDYDGDDDAEEFDE